MIEERLKNLLLFTNSFALRHFNEGDIEDLSSLYNNKLLRESFGWIKTNNKKYVSLLLESLINNEYMLAIQYDENVIGCIEIEKQDINNNCRLTIVLDDKYRKIEEINEIIDKLSWFFFVIEEEKRVVFSYYIYANFFENRIIDNKTYISSIDKIDIINSSPIYA